MTGPEPRCPRCDAPTEVSVYAGQGAYCSAGCWVRARRERREAVLRAWVRGEAVPDSVTGTPRVRADQ